MPATLTKPKPRRGLAPPSNGHVPAVPPRDLVEALNLAIDLVDPSPYQPRQEFDAAEITALGESIRVQGQLQPIVVRSSPARPGRYELIAGERRLRAVRSIQQATIRAEVIAASDAQARELCLLENLQRKDLNALEEAAAFLAILQAPEGPKQAALAARLGVSQPHIANRLALLRFPPAVQAKIISGEIPASAARVWTRYADHPQLLAAALKELPKLAGGETHDVRGLDNAMLEAARGTCRPMTHDWYDVKTRRNCPCPKVTTAEREALAIVEVNRWNQRVAFATNTKLWHELSARESERIAAREAKREKRGNAKAAGKTKKPSAAEERAREEKLAGQFERRLQLIVIDWQRELLAATLRSGDVINTNLMRLALAAMTWCSDVGAPPDDCLAEVLRSDHRHDTWALLAKLNASGGGGVWDTAAAALAECFFDNVDGQPSTNRLVDAEEVVFWRKFFEIDLKTEWLNGQMGTLSEAYWRAHTKPQLIDLAAELKAGFDKQILSGSKEDLVAAFLAKRPRPEDKEVGLPMPKELLMASRPAAVGRTLNSEL